MEPTNHDLINHDYTVRDYLMYSKNLWRRNLASRLTELEIDINKAAKTPKLEVIYTDPKTRGMQQMTVEESIELQKLNVEEANTYIATTDALLALEGAALVAKYSPEALAPAKPVVEATPEAAKPEEAKVEEAKPAETTTATEAKI